MSGSWSATGDLAITDIEGDPTFWHSSFALNRTQHLAMRGKSGRGGKPATGGLVGSARGEAPKALTRIVREAPGDMPATGGTRSLEVRTAMVLDFPQLCNVLMARRDKWTMQEIYAHWCQMRQYCLKRQHSWPNPQHQQAAIHRYLDAGPWGWGKGRPAIGGQPKAEPWKKPGRRT